MQLHTACRSWPQRRSRSRPGSRPGWPGWSRCCAHHATPRCSAGALQSRSRFVKDAVPTSMAGVGGTQFALQPARQSLLQSRRCPQPQVRTWATAARHLHRVPKAKSRRLGAHRLRATPWGGQRRGGLGGGSTSKQNRSQPKQARRGGTSVCMSGPALPGKPQGDN